MERELVSDVVSITPEELAKRLGGVDGPVLLDVREPDEHIFSSIEGSRHIPLGVLACRVTELGLWKEREVVVYCHHGWRSLRGARILVRAGFTRVFNLAGGIDSWSLVVDPRTKRY